MAMPNNVIGEELIEKWGIRLDLEVGVYFLKGKQIPDLPKVEGDFYIDRNRGFDTASKLKLFEKDPFMYFCKYILELDLGDKSEESHFIIGNAVDYFVSYGFKKFFEKYFMPTDGEKTYKPDGPVWLEEDLGRIDFEIEEIQSLINAAEAKNRGTKLNNAKLEKVLEKKKFVKENLGKIILNLSDSCEIAQVMREMDRQPLFDLHNDEYEVQVEIKAKFKGLKLKATLDRELMSKNIIRDTKTAASKLNQNFRKTCNLAIIQYGYDFSMGFYEFMRWAHNGMRSEVILDFFGKGTESKFLSYKVPTEILNEQRERILGVLHSLKKCIDEKDFPLYTQLNTFPDAHVSAKYFEHSPAAIQQDYLEFQKFDLGEE